MDDPTFEVEAAPEGIQAGESPVPSTGGKLGRWIVSLAGIAAFAAFVSLFKVNTFLGVMVKPNFVTIGGITAQTYDKRGRDYVWRVWWRARHQVISLGPSWDYTAMMLVLGVLFLLLCGLAFWIALVPDEPADSPLAESDFARPQ